MATNLFIHADPLRPAAVSLADRTTFRIGGDAREFYAPRDTAELRQILGAVHRSGRRPFILGRGANTLFPDGSFTRPVISTENLRAVDVAGDEVHAACGARLSYLVQVAMRAGLSGLEGLVGIPGTCGGAVAMNAGGPGWSFGDHVGELVLVPLDGGPLIRRRGVDVGWRYRGNDLDGFVVVETRLRLTRGRRTKIRQSTHTRMLQKAMTQPLGAASAGCVFRNPTHDSAARLIDQLGLKGLRIGGASVSEQHANFIVNTEGTATARDVTALIAEVSRRVMDAHGVDLQTEVVQP